MSADIFTNDVIFQGNAYVKNLLGAAGCVTDTMVAPGANVNASKVNTRRNPLVTQTGTVAAGTYYVGTVRTTGATLVDLRAMITETIATGADRTVTIDCKKSHSGGAFASVLSATIVLNNATTLLTASVATFASTGLATGDVLQVTVAVAGAAGAQAAGLLVQLTFDENGT